MNDFFGNSAIPIEPNADMREAAHAIRQVFIAYTQAGFSEVQAMQLVLEVLRQGSSGNK